MAKLLGIETVMKNLNREITKIKNRSMAGLIQAAIIIRRDMDKTPPLIPIDLGNLRASSFITSGRGTAMGGSPAFKGDDASEMSTQHGSVLSSVRSKTAGRPIVALGFSANYAAFVEKDTTAKRKRSGSGGGFMEGSLTRNRPLILSTIAKGGKK